MASVRRSRRAGVGPLREANFAGLLAAGIRVCSQQHRCNRFPCARAQAVWRNTQVADISLALARATHISRGGCDVWFFLWLVAHAPGECVDPRIHGTIDDDRIVGTFFWASMLVGGAGWR